jgi:shikimate O-hydroxycinnamoyltransferase
MGYRLPLSPIDHIFTGRGSYPIEFIFRYGGRLDGSAMRRSLESALAGFPVLRSVLVRDTDHSFAFETSPEGVRFTECESPEDPDDPAHHHRFIDPVSTVEGEPLMRILLNHSSRGSVLGVSISHALADGFSYFHFLTAWSAAFHHQPYPNPVHSRELLIPSFADPGPKLGPEETLRLSGLFLEELRNPAPREELTWANEVFPQTRLNRMLEEAQKHCSQRLSHNDVLTAWLWQKYTLQWGATDGGDLSYISCPVDFRRIVENFPKTYFGNAVALATTSANFSGLEQADLGVLALKVRNAVAGINAERVRESMLCLEQLRRQHGTGVCERLHVCHPHRGLLVTNLSRLPVPQISFNAGPPAYFAILTQARRGAVVLPHPEGVEVRVCCP